MRRLALLRRRRADASPPPLQPPLQPPAECTSLVGTRAKVVAGVTQTGALTALEPAAGAVVFLTTGCMACRDIWAALADGRAEHVQIAAVITPDASLEDRAVVAQLADREVLMSSAAWFSYGAGPSPWVAVVLGGLIVAEGSVDGWDSLTALVRGPASDG